MNAVDALEPASILVYNVSTKSLNKFHKSAESAVDPGYLSQPESLKFNVKSVDDANAYAYGLFYKPKVSLTSLAFSFNSNKLRIFLKTSSSFADNFLKIALKLPLTINVKVCRYIEKAVSLERFFYFGFTVCC